MRRKAHVLNVVPLRGWPGILSHRGLTAALIITETEEESAAALVITEEESRRRADAIEEGCDRCADAIEEGCDRRADVKVVPCIMVVPPRRLTKRFDLHRKELFHEIYH